MEETIVSKRKEFASLRGAEKKREKTTIYREHKKEQFRFSTYGTNK